MFFHPDNCKRYLSTDELFYSLPPVERMGSDDLRPGGRGGACWFDGVFTVSCPYHVCGYPLFSAVSR